MNRKLVNRETNILIVSNNSKSEWIVGSANLRDFLCSVGYKNVSLAFSSDEALVELDQKEKATLIIMCPDIVDACDAPVPSIALHNMLTGRTTQPIITMTYGNLSHPHLSPEEEPGIIEQFKILAHNAGITGFLNPLSPKKNPSLMVAELTQRAALLKLMSDPLVDPITGGPNRGFGDRQLRVIIARARQMRSVIKCAFVDIDKFKRVNDYFNHAVGDKAIKAVYLAIKQRLRNTDLVYRWGGDEFVIFRCGPSDDRRTIVRSGQSQRRVEGNIESEFNVEEITQALQHVEVATSFPSVPIIKISASVGTSELPIEEIEDVMKRAERRARSQKDVHAKEEILAAACAAIGKKLKHQADIKMLHAKKLRPALEQANTEIHLFT